jgi:WD40 repeat protein
MLDSIFAMAITSNNRYLVTGSKDMSIKIWDLKPLNELEKSMEKAQTSR